MMSALPSRLIGKLGVTGHTEIRRLGGNENENYLLKTTHQDFIVKKIRGHTISDTELEAQYRAYLDASGLPVSRYESFGSGHVISIDEDDYVALVYRAGDESPRNVGSVKETASLLAQAHNLNVAKLPARHSWYAKDYITRSIDMISDRYAPAKTEFKKLDKEKINFWSDDLPKGIVHGDIQYENILTNNHGKVVSILDWEETAIEPLLLDVAHAVQQLAFDGTKCDEKFFVEFVDSYHKIRPLMPIEKKLFDKALQYTVLVLSVWAHVKASKNELDDKIFSRVGNYYKHSYVVPDLI